MPYVCVYPLTIDLALSLTIFHSELCFTVTLILHPTVFFPTGLEMISQVSFFVSALISSCIAAFHVGSCMTVFQSQGTIVDEYREAVALKVSDNLSRETKSKIRCEVEGAVLHFRVHNLTSFVRAIGKCKLEIEVLPASEGRRELSTSRGN
jgi:hypothetical protein